MTSPSARTDVRRFLERSRTAKERTDATVEACVHHLRRVRERVAMLRAGQTSDGGEAVAFSDMLDKLEASTRALGTVEDELHAQNDELRRAVTLLEQERAKYLDLFENATDAYLVTDGAGVVSDANAAARALLSNYRDGPVGRALTAYVMSRDVPRLRFVVKMSVDCGLPQEIDIRLRRRLTRSTGVSLTVHALHGPEGQLAALRWTLRVLKPRTDGSAR